MTIRDVLYANTIDIEANIIIGLYTKETSICTEYNIDTKHDKSILDNYLDEEITYITVRKTPIGTPYIYMEATI